MASLGCGLALVSDAQSDSSTTDRAVQIRVIIGSSDKASDTVIAVPPDTSWKGSISFRPESPSKNLDAGSAADWIHSQSALNGLQSTDIRPWHPFLKLKVQMVEQISDIDEKEFSPPADAISLSGKTVIGINPKPLQTSFPEWPSSLRQQHFLVTVEIVIGKDGRVMSAHADSGPPEAYKAAEAAARKWRYQPYVVAGEPTDVETKVQFQNQ
jgi:hypothetical protein